MDVFLVIVSMFWIASVAGRGIGPTAAWSKSGYFLETGITSRKESLNWNFGAFLSTNPVILALAGSFSDKNKTSGTCPMTVEEVQLY